jgi:hypothetical protein
MEFNITAFNKEPKETALIKKQKKVKPFYSSNAIQRE